MIPKPALIVLDAFGTLFTPKGSAFKQYSEFAARYNIIVTPNDVEQKFKSAFKHMRREFPNYGKAAGLTVEDWWSSVVKAVFEKAPLPSGAQSKLYQQFNCGTAYYLYPDAIPMLDDFVSQGIPVAVLSNSDGRIRRVMDDLGLTQYIAKSPVTGKPSINLSYDLGVEKPDKKAFQLVRELMNIRDPTMCWYVGDDADQDFCGALAAGWNAVLLDRTGIYTNIRDNLQDRGIKSADGSVLVTSSPAKAYIESLTQLKALLNNGF